jgi:glycosyltransferase involved in cell wall biosynthesis
LPTTSAPPPSSLAISWVLSTISGYGIYGLQILLQFLSRGGEQIILSRTPSVTVVPPLVEARLKPIFALAEKLDHFLRDHPEETLNFKHAVLHGCSSDFSGFPGQEKIWGNPNVACCAIEHLGCTPHGLAVAKKYDMFIAISRWNEAYLKSLNVGPVHLCYQGIDPSLFHPATKSGLYRNRFVVFSGGKFEFRKGQDIVLAAFKRFRAKHPEALLVTCWQNLTKPLEQAFDSAGHCTSVPEMAPDYGLQITPWLLREGLPPGSFIDLPFTHNMLMPSVLAECDVAVFPNRCEGGTNLVAMEAMACGVPTYVAYNTGQKDLVDLIGCGGFKHQNAVKGIAIMRSVKDWGETEVDDVVAALEYVFTNRDDAQKAARVAARNVGAWQWGVLNEKLLEIVCNPQKEAA